jgi:hypothetical protein
MANIISFHFFVSLFRLLKKEIGKKKKIMDRDEEEYGDKKGDGTLQVGMIITNLTNYTNRKL